VPPTYSFDSEEQGAFGGKAVRLQAVAQLLGRGAVLAAVADEDQAHGGSGCDASLRIEMTKGPGWPAVVLALGKIMER
jgi:hypothetical protein